ncbi:Tetraspanin [Quillaja saponaria]|uniref:Tetraspanin n=1 Tax=Quillaja saponaria TaxID=32244 RepID=A0AAD7P7D9_QUISA|nr:Tetraspanin [Quillaja saponaria]
MGLRTSTFVFRWINFLTMLLAIAVIVFGVWMSTHHHDGCRKSLTLPVLGLGAFIFLISIIGFLGALKNNSILLWLYLIFLFFILVGILVFTVLAFIVTNNGSGHGVAGLRYKEYQLQDYSSWFLKQLNNSHNWERLKSCLVKSDDCSSLSKTSKLTPIEAGCCRPPSHSNNDCKLYKNSRGVKCYNCDSCKAGVAQYMKTEWRVVAMFNVVLFIVLSFIYFVGCCARRNAARSNSNF